MKFWLLMTITMLLGVLTVQAQETETDPLDFPTYRDLTTTDIPLNDPVDLASRFRGVAMGDWLSVTPPQYAVGDREALWASNAFTFETFPVESDLRAIGEHVYIWVEQGAPVSDQQAQAVAQTFDEVIYEPVRALWGPEATPGVDGDSRLHVLFAYNLGAGVGAYFAQRHTYPDAVVTPSNQREMFFVNLSAYPSITAGSIASTLAHEFQHMIRHNLDTNEDTWLNEGFSTFTEYYLGYQDSFRYTSMYTFSPEVQLNTFGLSNDYRGANYGAGFMFVTYFYHRYGEDGIRELSGQTDNGLLAVQAALETLDPATDAPDFFADWVLATYIQDETFEDGRYSYPDDLPVSRPTIQRVGSPVPYTWEVTANQYSAAYYEIDGLQDGDKLDVMLDAPETVGLIPTTAASGQRLWYSNRADTSNTRLTRSFDLRDVDSATLTFKTWYAIEELWDYAYVSASIDDGATWTLLETPDMTTENPFGNAYGAGYSGYSDGWIDQSIRLDGFTGHEVLLRFEYITDDAVTEHGIALDDIAIPEIGYFSDLEADGGGWQAEGWLLIDNILPQRAWVQVIELNQGIVQSVTRWQAPAQGWSLPLKEGTDRAVLVVSPFAPVTTVPVDYTLRVDVAGE
jgi:immune inhibitor A